jgi:hypothetical protein
LFEAMRNAKMSSQVAVALVYVFAAAVTIVHIVTVIYYGLQFSSLTSQPSYWLYSVLLAILFEFVIVKVAIFLLDIFGISTVYKFIEIVFFKEEWTAPTPTEVYGEENMQQSTPKTTGKVTKAIKGATQATFEKGFEEEEFGNLGPVEEEKKESETNSEPKHTPQGEVDSEAKHTLQGEVDSEAKHSPQVEVEEEDEVERNVPKDVIRSTRQSTENVVEEMRVEDVRHDQKEVLPNPSRVDVDDLF